MASTHVAAAPGPARPADKPGNTIGRMTGLTLFTPVRAAWLPVAKAAFLLGQFIPLAQQHILQFNFIHYVRWTHVHKLPTGRGSSTPTCSSRATSTGPGSTTSTRSRTCIPQDIRFVWGRGINFPARRRPSR